MTDIYYILTVATSVWRTVTSCLPHSQIQDISEPVIKREHGHAYWARKYMLDETKPKRRIVDPALFGRDRDWESLIMNGKCEWFCVMMERIIRERVQVLLGPDADARWVMCKPKPISTLAEDSDDKDYLEYHSVIEVTLTDKSKWIFDGTIPQYGYPLDGFWLLESYVYEARHTLPVAGRHFWEPKPEQRTRAKITFAKADDDYWCTAKTYLQVLMKQLEWSGLSTCAQSEIADMVERQAMDDFGFGILSHQSTSSARKRKLESADDDRHISTRPPPFPSNHTISRKL
ncbi:hypothetical protein DE146DRAFT_770414 [Phaeosphaeria sp. MPI-PUGE-AT-0046c]|nr:hypothetical protein DE146DRAFT_770414 [Phaeosphaeria sp. MPI-PUGE-AT-0046c]